MSDWQPISTAPLNEYVLVFCPDAEDGCRIMVCGKLMFEGDPDPPKWYEQNLSDSGHPLDVEPTRWMPLPAEPAVSS